MKMLVCIDGSEQSQKAVNKAIELAEAYKLKEVSLIHVYESAQRSYWLASAEGYSPSPEDLKRLQRMQTNVLDHRKNMMDEAAIEFEKIGIDVEMIVEEGHPSHTIARIADDGNYDMVILGSRGLGGLKKIFLGSVSNAVIQETKASVLVVK
ncbi:MAG: universal stress protein [Tindallia sp. MSAO_Bac2]|nr:MAG: universal stress protein [Tindallia sp. MSAO_Bac2]